MQLNQTILQPTIRWRNGFSIFTTLRVCSSCFPLILSSSFLVDHHITINYRDRKFLFAFRYCPPRLQVNVHIFIQTCSSTSSTDPKNFSLVTDSTMHLRQIFNTQQLSFKILTEICYFYFLLQVVHIYHLLYCITFYYCFL